MKELTAFQIEFLESVLEGNAQLERASQLKSDREAGYFLLTFDKWQTVKRIPREGEESFWAIEELVQRKLLDWGTMRQPVARGFERRDFYHVSPLGRQTLAAIKLERMVVTA